jgi:preprotein translocase subunit YajC
MHNAPFTIHHTLPKDNAMKMNKTLWMSGLMVLALMTGVCSAQDKDAGFEPVASGDKAAAPAAAAEGTAKEGTDAAKEGDTEEKAAEKDPGGPDMKIMLLMVGGVVFLFWMSSSKQRKQRKQQQQMLAGLAKGDKVVSIGGICGTITQLGEEEVVVKIDGDVKMTFLRSAIRTQETIGDQKK